MPSKCLFVPAVLLVVFAESIIAQSTPRPSNPAASVTEQDPVLIKRATGDYLIPRQDSHTAREVELTKFLDEKVLPIAQELLATTAPTNAPITVTVDRNGRSTILAPTSVVVQPSRELLRSELFAALQSSFEASAAIPPGGVAAAPPGGDPLASAVSLPRAQLTEFTRALLKRSEDLRYSPKQTTEPSGPGVLPNASPASAPPGFPPIAIERLTWNWDSTVNWAASVPDSTQTQTSTFTADGKDNTVFTRLEYKWTLAGGATVWPEVLSAAGTWYNDGPPDGMPMAEFKGFYTNAATTKSTFDRMVQLFEAQNRIRWKSPVAGTVQAFHMEGDTTRYIPPPELPSDGHIPRESGDMFRTVLIGMPGWRNVGIENKKSTGLIMPSGTVDGRVAANQNTGINGGDRVYLSADGIIGYRSPEGFYFNLQAPNNLRISFEPADGSPAELMYPFQFPRTFTRRGSLYLYLDRPTWAQWTPTFERGGYAVSLTIQRNPDSDNDGLTDFEEVSGIPGWKTKILRRSDPRKVDTDGDTVSDFDEVFGWQYQDRRSGETRRADDTDPLHADEFYARQYLRNATYYKFKFQRDRTHVSYSDAVSFIDDTALQAMKSAFVIARVVSQTTNPQSPVILDVLREKSTLELLRAQDALQRAYQARFTGTGLAAIASERAAFGAASQSYDAGVGAFFGADPSIPENDVLTSFYTLTKSLSSTRKPWDTDAGEDTSTTTPNVDMKELAKLLAGRLETANQDAELYHLQYDSNPLDLSTKDKARQILIAGLARTFIGEAILEGAVPSPLFGSTGGAQEITALATQVQAAESRYALIDRGSENSLGLDPNFVRFAFNPESDPAASIDNPRTNFAVMMDQLHDTLRPVRLAIDKESQARTDQRAFETTSAQFEQARLQNQVIYDQQLNTYKLEFESTKAQVNIATQELQKARNDLNNIYSSIQIEQQRVAQKSGIRYEVGQQIAQVFLDTGEALAANEYALGEINATDAEIQGLIQAMSSMSISAGYPSGISASVNPGQMVGGVINSIWGPYAARERAALAASNQRIQALEKARVQMLNVQLDNKLEQADSEAHVRTMLLGIANATIDVRIKLIQVAEAIMRMQDIATIIQGIQLKQAQADQTVKNLFGDPSYRLIRNETRESAETLFQKAREEVYLTARAFEYETTWRSATKAKLFIARSADELNSLIADLSSEWDRFSNLTTARVPTPVRISLREDILGYRFGTKDPQTGQPIDPRVSFRNYLKSISTGNNKVFRIEFYGAMNEWAMGDVPAGFKTVWSIPRSVFDTKIQLIAVALIGNAGPGQLGDDAATVRIELGGLNWIRSSEGTEKPPADSPEPWKYKENILRNTVVRYTAGPSGTLFNVPQIDVDRTVPVQVGTSGPTFKWWGLFNQSPVRRWVITLNLTEGGNQDINIDALDDIELNILLRSYDLP